MFGIETPEFLGLGCGSFLPSIGNYCYYYYAAY